MPMVAAVATLEPETAAKIAHEKMLATASPPGRKPTQRATAVKRPLPMPEWSRMPLMKTKSGTAMKEKLVAFDHAMEPDDPESDRPALEIEQSQHAHHAHGDRDLEPHREEQEHQRDEETAETGFAHRSLRRRGHFIAPDARAERGAKLAAERARPCRRAMSRRPAGIRSMGTQSG